jgi:hypothetical protein
MASRSASVIRALSSADQMSISPACRATAVPSRTSVPTIAAVTVLVIDQPSSGESAKPLPVALGDDAPVLDHDDRAHAHDLGRIGGTEPHQFRRRDIQPAGEARDCDHERHQHPLHNRPDDSHGSPVPLDAAFAIPHAGRPGNQWPRKAQAMLLRSCHDSSIRGATRRTGSRRNLPGGTCARHSHSLPR